MKKELIFVIVLLLFRFQNSYSQSEGPRDAMSSSYSAFGCLACPGGEWQNFSNVSHADHLYASCGLSTYPMCFQTTCYYSRILFATHFGFAIPSAAVIRGVTADVLRLSDAVNGVSDSMVSLYLGSPIGINHASPVFWTLNPMIVTYGDSADTWGYPLTADSVNSTQFGLALMAMNKNFAATFNIASVDHIQMTVYYSTGTGIESQTRTLQTFGLKYDKDNSTLNLFSADEQKINSLRVVNALGNEIFSSADMMVSKGSQQISFPNISMGIYFAVITTNGKTIVKKFAVE